MNARKLPASTDQHFVPSADDLNAENHWTTTWWSVDERIEAACNDLNGAENRAFAVLVVDGDASLVQNSAIDPSIYFKLTRSNHIAVAFNEIRKGRADLWVDE